MKKRILLLMIACVTALSVVAQGFPLMCNYLGKEYGAHNRNFDVVCGEDGMLFVANFEGLLYYDKAQWHVIHTQGIHRLTAVFRDTRNSIWVGGYNFVGYLAYDEAGRPQIKSVTPNGSVPFHGQVDRIWQDKKNGVCFQTSSHSIYCAQGTKLVPVDAQPPVEEKVTLDKYYDVKQVLTIHGGLRAVATVGNGVIILDKEGRQLYHLDEDYGLCNNNVYRIAYDGHGLLWGATDKGLFSISLPSIYSRFTDVEGLRGEVMSIQVVDDVLFAGTLNGLFRRVGQRFEPVTGIHHACWQLKQDGNSLLAATTNGVYRVMPNGSAQQLTTASSTAVLPVDGGFLSGELDGLFFYKGTNRSEESDAEKVTHLYQDKDGNIWVRNIYGQVFLKRTGTAAFELLEVGKRKDEVNMLVFGNADIFCVNMENVWRWNGKLMVGAGRKLKELMPFPSFSYTDTEGYIWLTDAEGHNLNVIKDEEDAAEYNIYVLPFKDYVVRSFFHQGSQMWVGGDFGMIGIRRNVDDPLISMSPRLLIRSVVVQGDSLIWGGFGDQPTILESFDSDIHDIQINYSLDYMELLGNTAYRYRLNGGNWTVWNTNPQAHFVNMASGIYTMEIQGRDSMGRLSETVTLEFTIRSPFYLRWFMQLLYFVLLGIIIYLLVRWRMHRLEQDKIRLESIVQERTAEVAKQKDELMRQEKMATVGKLTQGLIDRILNPMNYINNFSKLSSDLIKDVRANVKDEEEHMDEENYQDTMEVLDMLTQNLSKVEQHGMNTTRTLKAMEEMLKDRSGGMIPMNLVPMLQKNFEMLNQYFQNDIHAYGIHTTFDCAYDELQIRGNAEQLSKSIMSFLGNSIYAVVKQAERAADYHPEILLSVSVQSSDIVCIRIYDNGTGIEETIIDKIFDPFFTTKTTGEASGVGLYLSHEIVQNHGGDITVKSEKDKFTEFVITIPMLKH